jgi:ribosome-binding factor A
MSDHRNPRRRRRPLSGMVHSEDGMDPRKFFSPQSRPRSNRKLQQLCKQVSQTLDQVLSGECNDDVLRGLTVIDVKPAPDATCLMVFLSSLPGEKIDPVVALERLGRVRSKLRFEIASAISRKRTPELLFTFASPSGDSHLIDSAVQP